MTKYVAEFRNAMPNLSRIEIGKETEKTFTVIKEEKLFGWIYFGTYCRRSSYCLFDTLEEALDYLVDKANAYVTHTKNAYEDALQKAEETRELLSKYRLERKV